MRIRNISRYRRQKKTSIKSETVLTFFAFVKSHDQMSEFCYTYARDSNGESRYRLYIYIRDIIIECADRGREMGRREIQNSSEPNRKSGVEGGRKKKESIFMIPERS